MNRRKFLLGSAAAGAAGAAAYKDTLGILLSGANAGESVRSAVYGNSLEAPKSVCASVCNGCPTHCGVMVGIDADGCAQKVMGNPFSPLSAEPAAPMSMAVAAAVAEQNRGEWLHASVCARGNMIIDKLDHPARVKTILKRVGARGSGEWRSIEPADFLREITEGGDLFGEGAVAGLREIYDPKTPLDAAVPAWGPKSNQLAIIATGDEGRKAFVQERFQKSFGTINFFGHTASCGLSMRAGMAAFCDDFAKYPHLKPDFANAKLLICLGSAPNQAGNPFKRQAFLMSERAAEGLESIAITPVLTNSSTQNNYYFCIKPGGDLALAMALIAGVLRRGLEKREYLRQLQPSAQYPSSSNACYLIALEDGAGQRAGEFVRINGECCVAAAAGGAGGGAAGGAGGAAGGAGGQNPTPSENVVFGSFSAQPLSAAGALASEEALEFDGVISTPAGKIRAISAFAQLRKNAYEHEISWLLERAGAAQKDYDYLLRRIEEVGGKIALDTHAGTMQTTGFYAVFAFLQLAALFGRMNARGGMSAGGGKFNALSGRYELAKFAGKNKPSGQRIDLSKKPYEKSPVFAGYPSPRGWHSLANALYHQAICNAAAGWPYEIKALISCGSNPAYASSARTICSALASRKIGLFIAVDPFINETSAMADYIVPDAVLFETWGVVSPWGGTLARASHFRLPLREAPNVRWANGEAVTLDSFLIELGKALGLAGFGAGAIKAADGSLHALDRPQDFYLRAFANVAHDGGAANEFASEQAASEAAEYSALPYAAAARELLGADAAATLFCMARGGRFESTAAGYDAAGHLARKYQRPVALYSEPLAQAKNSYNGQNYSGAPKFFEQQSSDGKPLGGELFAFNYKSNIFSSFSGASSALSHLRYSNFVELHEDLAASRGIKNGDLVRVQSAGGRLIGIARTRRGIHPQAIGIEHGRMRRAEGGVAVVIDGERRERELCKATGVSMQPLVCEDPARPGELLSDFVIGSIARTAIPVSIERITDLADI